jgi:hypothetical protein
VYVTDVNNDRIQVFAPDTNNSTANQFENSISLNNGKNLTSVSIENLTAITPTISSVQPPDSQMQQSISKNTTVLTRPEMRMVLEFDNYYYSEGYTSLCTGDRMVDPGMYPGGERYLRGVTDAQKDFQLDPQGFMKFCFKQYPSTP